MAVEAVHGDYVDDRPITVVDVAALRPETSPPPGLDRFPAPGEVWFSPEPARLVKELTPGGVPGLDERGRVRPGGTAGRRPGSWEVSHRRLWQAVPTGLRSSGHGWNAFHIGWSEARCRDSAFWET